MNEHVIKMAREARLLPSTKDCDPWHVATVVRFYNMARAEERDVCEKICDDLADRGKTAYQCRDAIHARNLNPPAN